MQKNWKSRLEKVSKIGAHLHAAVRDYKGVASIFPSSPFAARAIARHVEPTTFSVLEYGPGTGVITREILAHLSSSARIVAIEANEKFAPALEAVRDSRLALVHGKVPAVLPTVRAMFPDGVDAVFSGIPFSLMSPEVREEIVKATHAFLKPQGKFVVYQNSRLMLPLLERYFEEVDCKFEPRNIFPYFILSASK